MKFGFLIDSSSVQCQDFKIHPLNNFDETMNWFYDELEVSHGWIYPPTKNLKHNSNEQKVFKQSPPVIRDNFYQLPSTHRLVATNYNEHHKIFLILGYGFLQGLYLIPENYKFLGRIPYKPSTLNGLILNNTDRVLGMEAINKFYINSTDKIRIQMRACIHWFLIAQTLDFHWDIFDAHYKVLDGLFKLSNETATSHAERPIKLASLYNIDLPSWAKLQDKKSKLSQIRNALVHEAKFADESIGYAYPEENFKLEFTNFNLKLLCATLGINTPFIATPVNNRLAHLWNIKP